MKTTLVKARNIVADRTVRSPESDVIATFEFAYHLHRGDYVHAAGRRYRVCEIDYVATDNKPSRIYEMICAVADEGPSYL